jgi:hypothetical protein
MSDSNFSTIVKYIKHNVGDLSVTERQDILQMIVNSSIDDSKIQTKGNGTQIKIRDIPRPTVYMIHNYIQTKLLNKINALQFFPDKDDEDEGKDS